MPRLDSQLPADIFVKPPLRSARPRERNRDAVEGLLARGTIVDKYRIEELLGTGGFAAVYRATHMLLDMPVALKHLRPDVLAQATDIARLSAQLLDEARCAARIRHPSVVRVYDVTQTPTLTYIVMEFIDGETLARVIQRRQPLPIDEVIGVGVDIAEGLQAASECGIVHRDVKPANVLVTKSGRACLVDLGLARAAAVGRCPSASGASAVVGTRGYAAPEQLRDPSQVDFRADMYSLGVTLMEALRDRGSRGEPCLAKGGHAPAPSLLVRLLAQMTAQHREDRPSSYRELLDALRAARTTHAGHAG